MRPPIADLLLQLVHQDPTTQDSTGLALLSPDEWTTLITAAIRYRLAFQVREYLRADPGLSARAPPESLRRLHRAVRTTLMTNLRRQGQLRQMLDACESAGIPCMLMKGLWLVEAVYRDLKARPSGDIDLLIRPADMPAFTRLARRLGFPISSAVGDLRRLAPAYHELMLTHPISGAAIDVHWALTRPQEEAPVDEERFWHRGETVQLAGRPCFCPCLEDHLLLLCFHAAIHHRFVFVGPRALMDVATLVMRPPRPIDWDDLLRRAHELGWERGVWLFLDLVREHLGAQLPDRVMETLRPADADDPAIRHAAMEAVFLDQQHREILGETIIRLLNETSTPRRIALLFGRIWPTRDQVASQFRVGADQTGFYWLYVQHWQRLLRQVTPRLIQIWRQAPNRQSELTRSLTIARWLQKG